MWRICWRSDGFEFYEREVLCLLWCSDGRVHYICEGVLHQKEEAMKITTKQITTTAVLLAICIVSQFFKNTSVYITGPVINACLILAVLSVGIPWRHYSLCDHAGHIILYYGKPDHRCLRRSCRVSWQGNALLVLGVGLVTKKCKGTAD